jgi:E3 ubiquitin-protein ligase BAH
VLRAEHPSLEYAVAIIDIAMKFAREFRDALRDYPESWVEAAIPYGVLKKCLKSVSLELQSFGLDADTLRQLLDAQATSSTGGSVPIARYNLDGNHLLGILATLGSYFADMAVGDESGPRPRLTVLVQFQDGLVVDAKLSKSSKAFLRSLAAKEDLTVSPEGSRRGSAATTAGEYVFPATMESPLRHSVSRKGGLGPANFAPSASSIHSTDLTWDSQPRMVEIPLRCDEDFFRLIDADIATLDGLERVEEAAMTSDVKAIAQEVTQVTKPTKYSKSDLSRWRDIFELYLDAQVFFSTHEQDHGARSSSRAVQQLDFFENEVRRRDIIRQFKLKLSHAAYERFIGLNHKLLQNLKFQEINRIALMKILKSMKFPLRLAYPTMD